MPPTAAAWPYASAHLEQPLGQAEEGPVSAN
jgi:hypothetical protein